jgi:cell division control protein 6
MYAFYSKTVFKDLRALSFEYVPPNLPHREKQLERLYTLFKPLFMIGRGQNVFLKGSVGTGKTVVSKKFCIDFQRKCYQNGKNIRFVFVNCREANSNQAVMLKILHHFQTRFPDRGFSISEMIAILRNIIVSKNIHMLIVLDDCDTLLQKSTELIFNFTRFNDTLIEDAKSSVSLILISQSDIFQYLDRATISTFKRTNIVEFGKYSASELLDILYQRVELAFLPDVVSEDAIELIADIASEWGDARYAIEILEKAGLLADESNSDCVTVEDVRAARAVTYSVVTEDKLKDLADHAKLILLAIARSLRKKGYVQTSYAEKNYEVVCEEYDVKKVGHTQFWKYLKHLDSTGMINTKISYGGKDGKTTFISIPNIPVDVLEKKLCNIIEKKV